MFPRLVVMVSGVRMPGAILFIPTSIYGSWLVMLILKCPRCGGGAGNPTSPSLDGAPCFICLSCKQGSMKKDWEAGEQWTGQIVTASFENGTGDLDCGLEGCECPEHEGNPPPEGTYITIRLDGEGHRIGLSTVTVTINGDS